MDLHHLWLFYKVAQNLSFTKTAEELFISQPTISVQVKKLEQSIGLKLLELHGKNIYLTQYGQVVFGYAQKIFSLVEDMEGEISLLKGRMSGNLNIGASNTPGIYIIPGILGQFKRKYPDVKTSLHIGTTYEVQNMLINNMVDFAVIGGEMDLPKAYIADKLAVDNMIIIVSPDHPLAEYHTINTRMLMGQEFIVHEPASNLYDAVEKIITRDLNLPMNVALTLGSVDAIKYAVRANLGISIIPQCAARQDISLGLLKSVQVENMEWKYSFSLVYHKDKNMTLPIKMMIQTIKENSKEMFHIS
jgi:DNA-binding transcriptional LysR family regulator